MNKASGGDRTPVELFQIIKDDFVKVLHSVCQQIWKTQQWPQDWINICFIDYAKAFDCVDHNKLWKILEEMGIPDHLTCLLRNLYAGQGATVRTGHGTTDWFQIEKGVCQGYILSPCLLTYMQSTSWETLGWKKHKLESRLLWEISITSDRQMIPPLWQKAKKDERTYPNSFLVDGNILDLDTDDGRTIIWLY